MELMNESTQLGYHDKEKLFYGQLAMCLEQSKRYTQDFIDSLSKKNQERLVVTFVVKNIIGDGKRPHWNMFPTFFMKQFKTYNKKEGTWKLLYTGRGVVYVLQKGLRLNLFEKFKMTSELANFWLKQLADMKYTKFMKEYKKRTNKEYYPEFDYYSLTKKGIRYAYSQKERFESKGHIFEPISPLDGAEVKISEDARKEREGKEKGL